jgi:hypothetical protein
VAYIWQLISIKRNKKNMEDEFIDYELVLETQSAGDHAFLKSILDAEGITYFIQGEYVAPYVYHAVPMRLMVKKDQAEKAREILKDVDLSSAYDGFKHFEDKRNKK